jgi:hypothetical protein
MDTAAWYQAAHSSPPIVLGLKLRPYSLGHEILLGRFNSLFAGGPGEEAQLFPELSLACLICSQDYQSALRFLESPWRVNLFLKVWRYAIGRQMRRSEKRESEKRESVERSSTLHAPDAPRSTYFERELQKFLSYRKAASWFPDENVPVGGRTLAAPWPFRWLTWLMAELHLTEDQALNYPLARASALYCARQEARGKLQLFNDQDNELFSARDALDAANAWDAPDISAILKQL